MVPEQAYRLRAVRAAGARPGCRDFRVVRRCARSQLAAGLLRVARRGLKRKRTGRAVLTWRSAVRAQQRVLHPNGARRIPRDTLPQKQSAQRNRRNSTGSA